MKRLILNLFFFFIGLFIIDAIYGVVMTRLFEKARGGVTGKTKYICDSTHAELVILGSSRARMHYDPKILADSLGMSCYNCGENGMGIIADYAKLKILSQRYMPKMVIIDVLPILDEMTRDDNIIFVNELRPWYDKTGIDSIFWKIDKTEKIKMVSQMYKYHSKFLEYYYDGKSQLPKDGYEPSPATKIISGKDLYQEEPRDNIIDEVKMYFAKKLIEEFKDKTKLVFVASPRYRFKTSLTVNPLRDLCLKNNVTLIDWYANREFVDVKELYADGNHMNVRGATLFSKALAHHLKRNCLVKMDRG